MASLTSERRPSLTRRGSSYRLLWRYKGQQQSCTFADNETGNLAIDLLMSFQRRISRAGLYAALDQALGVERQPQPSEQTSPWFPDVCADFLADKQVEVRESTWKSYRVAIVHHVLPHFQVFADGIDSDSVKKWRNGQIAAGYSPRSVANWLMVFKLVLETMVGTVYTKNPAKGVKFPKIRRTEQVFLASWEWALMRLFLPGVMRDLGDLAVATGCRIGEMIALQVRDIAFTTKGAVVYVTKSIKADGEVGDTKSATSVRSVSVSPSATALLARLCDGKGMDAPLFLHMDGTRLTTGQAGTMFRRAVVMAQRCDVHPPEQTTTKTGRLRVAPDAVSTCKCANRLHQAPRFHDLRHTHAAWLVDLGWGLDEIQIRLGHASIVTTRNLYYHRFQRHDGDRLAALDVYETAPFEPTNMRLAA